jgi:hypothetical protein
MRGCRERPFFIRERGIQSLLLLFITQPVAHQCFVNGMAKGTEVTKVR